MATAPAPAVILGEPTAPRTCSTLLLRVGAVAASEAGLDATGSCSAAVLGTRPLTLITAGHCFKDVQRSHDTRLPTVRIETSPSSALARAPLKAAVYPDFATIERNLAEDLAILVFEFDASDEFEALPLFHGPAPGTARLCGYGRGAQEDAINRPRCAEKPLVTEIGEFGHFVPLRYEALDPLLYLQFRVQFQAKDSALSSLRALIAVNRLDAAGDYSLDLPMPTRGDSGGPWIVADEQGRPQLLAITSFIETFYRRNKQWPFFHSHATPLTDFPYVAYGVRLDTPEAQARIASARSRGADIGAPTAQREANFASTSSQR